MKGNLTMDASYLGKLIKHLRTQNNMKQEELAEQLGVSSSAISKWETGKNLPDIAVLEKISALFQISIEELFRPEETLLHRAESATASDNTSTKNKKRHLSILVTAAVLCILLITGFTMYFCEIGPFSQNARPVASRMIEDENLGSVYELAIVYSGNLDKLSDPTTDYMELIYSTWCDNTNVPSEITVMKVSFYKTEKNAFQWSEPQKSTYFIR